MGLVDYIFHQLNQKAKVTNKYDEEIAVATIIRIRGAIAAICINSAPTNCQSQHISAVNSTHSKRLTNNHQTNNSKLLSALYSDTHQLLISKSTNEALIQLLQFPNMSNTNTSPQTQSGNTGRLTFQSTHNSEV